MQVITYETAFIFPPGAVAPQHQDLPDLSECELIDLAVTLDSKCLRGGKPSYLRLRLMHGGHWYELGSIAQWIASEFGPVRGEMPRLRMGPVQSLAIYPSRRCEPFECGARVAVRLTVAHDLTPAEVAARAAAERPAIS